FEWLDALERTGCVVPKRGWLPMHLGFYLGGELVALSPAYVKGNSEGEFVFDHSWARFAEAELGLAYYPKLIAAVPFPPSTGRAGGRARRAARPSPRIRKRSPPSATTPSSRPRTSSFRRPKKPRPAPSTACSNATACSFSGTTPATPRSTTSSPGSTPKSAIK